jgi:penicillin-insensitive murein DD-endopeptidase
MISKLWLPVFILLLLTSVAAEAQQESICYGTPEKGRLEKARQLPGSGSNFAAYSLAGITAGRNYVHSKIAAVVLDAYNEVHQNLPQKQFVYGETGWKNGGRFRPHKTHQNGLSVDFFVPVTDATDKSVPLPTSILNKFGYAIEFDAQGKYRNYKIDFAAMAAHLLALKKAADRRGVKIRRVIFDNELQKLLFQTAQGKELRAQLIFSRKKPWVRHDEHYHIDFIVPCEVIATTRINSGG